MSITDTAGCMTPHGMRYLVTAAALTGLDVQVHCRNDCLVMGNALAAVEAGAAGVDSSIRFGERADNVVMTEFVATLQCLYGLGLSSSPDAPAKRSQLVSELSCVPLGATQSLTGPAITDSEPGDIACEVRIGVNEGVADR